MKKLIDAISNISETGLRWDKEQKKHDEIQVNPPIFQRDNHLYISAESEFSYLFLDYYGEYRGGYAWIHPMLEKVAREFDGYWEWENPGCICFAS